MPTTIAGAGRQTVADITTTTKEIGGADMSELAKTIDRLEQWAEYWEPHQVPELIADLRVLIGTAKAVSRAIDWLQKAQRYDLQPHGDYYQGEGMIHSSSGDWIDIIDVKAAIDILQEGQQ